MSPGETRRPDFLLLGAPKCGTTSLAAYLGQHPDVCFSYPKEPVFFEAEYEKGLDFYWRKYFAHWQGERIAGEGRVFHLFLPFAPERIRASLPEARLIALLRNPVDRAYSHWWHRFSRGLETLSFAAAIEHDLAHDDGVERFSGEEGAKRWREGLVNLGVTTRHGLYLEVGRYAEQLERYGALFDWDRIKVLFYEDLSRDPRALTREVWSFLGVDPSAPLADAEARNVRRQAVRTPAAARVLQVGEALRRFVPASLRPRLRALLPERTAQQPPLDPGLRRELEHYFRPHNERLERLVGRDLSAWGAASR